jgi:hypothetical protein
MILKNIFATKEAKKLAVPTQNIARLCKYWIMAMVLKKNATFSPKKSAKIAVTGDHIIDPIFCRKISGEIGNVRKRSF